MSNNYFKFKEFTVFQDKCAMKVSTDGVLLGAWVDVENVINVLDVGTGTGLISLMIAQRNSKAYIDAIDIDSNCASQAEENIDASPFSNQISVHHVSFQQYSKSEKRLFDLIVSNPPYFRNSLQSINSRRNFARHDDLLSYKEILIGGSKILSNKGKIALILPYEFMEEAIEIANKESLNLQRITEVKSLPHKLPKRVLLEFTNKTILDTIKHSLIIEIARHQYSNEFILLLRDFYLTL